MAVNVEMVVSTLSRGDPTAENAGPFTNHIHRSKSISLKGNQRSRGKRGTIQLGGRGTNHVERGTYIKSKHGLGINSPVAYQFAV